MTILMMTPISMFVLLSGPAPVLVADVIHQIGTLRDLLRKLDPAET